MQPIDYRILEKPIIMAAISSASDVILSKSLQDIYMDLIVSFNYLKL